MEETKTQLTTDKSSQACELNGEQNLTDQLSPVEKQKSIDILNKRIDQFVDQFKHFPKQKSPEWVKLRTDGMGGVFLGGSDIGTAIDVNPYQSPGQLIRSKCGLKTARDNSDPIAMHWGSLFEDVIARYIEMDFKTTIKGTEMIICGHELFRYSPDGFIVACFKFVDGEFRFVPLDDPDGIPIIILCEIKSLWARVSKDYIPEYYVPQPMVGLEVAQIAHAALYVEGLFKVCSMEELGSSKDYSRKIHTRQRFLDRYPIAWGMFFISCEDEKVYDEFVADRDIGAGTLDGFKDVMKKIDSGVFTAEFTDPKPYSQDAIETLLDAAQNCEDRRYFIGVIPWKLFDISYFQLDRDSSYVPGISKQLKDMNDVIRRAKEFKENLLEEFLVKEMQSLHICDDERGIFEPVSDNYRPKDVQSFLNSL